MSDNTPYETPQTAGAHADNRRLHRIARVILRLATGCFICGSILFACCGYIVYTSTDRLFYSGVELQAEEIAGDMARTARAAWWLGYVGCPAMVGGGIVMVMLQLQAAVRFRDRKVKGNSKKDK